MKKLLVLVTYHLKDNCAKDFVAELEESGAAELVRKENGCKRYDYFFSVADKNTVLLVEEWESLEKQQIHLTQPHMATVRAIKEKYALATDIQLNEVE